MSNTTPFKNTNEQLALISIDFDIWSGQTRLRAEDLRLGDGGEIPPEKLAQLGTKRICDPKVLRPFHKLKTRARRLILDHGRPFLGGFAVPRTAIATVTEGLELIKGDFDQHVDDFTQSYENSVNEWIAENPVEYGEAIRRGSLSAEEVKSRFGLDYQFLEVSPVNSDAAVSLNRKLGGLSDDLTAEIIDRAKSFIADNLGGGRQEVSAQTKQSLLKLRSKVSGMAFLNAKFKTIVDLLDTALREYPEKGTLSDEPFFKVLTICLILSDEEKLKQYLSGELTLEAMLSKNKPADESAEQAGESTEEARSDTSEQTSNNSNTDGDFFF